LTASFSPRSLPGGIDAETFLAQYWQHRPLLVRDAFPGWRNPLQPDELAGLACEPEVESRIVTGRIGGHWQLEHGPFDESAFAGMPARDWTLLVQSVDQWVPAVATLRNRFRFVPDWRLDDVMVSYATPGGSVGPHVDQYDVFLLQGMGRRRWQLAAPQPGPPAHIPDLDLQVLARFAPEQEYTLGPGDMLYLPPGWAHYGLALDACMTYSIGFRAPSAADLLGHFCDEVASHLDQSQRYADPGLQWQCNPGEISGSALDAAWNMLQGTFEAGRPHLADWFGRMVTEPKTQANRRPTRRLRLRAHIAAGGRLVVAATSRLAYVEAGATTLLFCDGIRHEMGGQDWRSCVHQLCGKRRLAANELRVLAGKRKILAALQTLVDAGALGDPDAR